MDWLSVASEGKYLGLDGKRLRWVDRRLKRRVPGSRRRADSGVERLFGTPGDWDYDYATDLELEAKQAEQTLRALEAERTHILARQKHLEGDSAAGKYQDES